MLNLKTSTPPWWAERVEAHLEEILVDHAHCEKKAAGTAMNLIFAYVDKSDVVRPLKEIVEEELSHFVLVTDLIASRGMRFRKLPPSQYGPRLHELIRKQEPARAVDRMLVAALIEARSCERFALLRDRIADPDLSAFYGGLFESEARHHGTYVSLAAQFAPAAEVHARLDELAAQEAAIIDQGDPRPRVHG
jgi:tRNA-(ms[2]io[6]A)-hydroxylase